MIELLRAFALGNAAILGNVCLLPLYPGLFALLASRTGDDERNLRWLGAVVLAGVLSLMIVMAGILYLVRREFSDILLYILPVAFGFVLVLGVLMILDRNPLARIGTAQAPIVGSPAGSAFLYGAALAPMTLPCTGPVIIAQFVLGGVSGTGALLEGLAYFVAFGLGFGWPLVVLPFIAGSQQQRFTRFLGRHHTRINRVSGVLLIVVALLGLYFDFLQ